MRKIVVTGVLAGLVAACAIGRVRADPIYKPTTCAEVRMWVALYGRVKAKAIAIKRGATEDEIVRAEACLDSRVSR